MPHKTCERWFLPCESICIMTWKFRPFPRINISVQIISVIRVKIGKILNFPDIMIRDLSFPVNTTIHSHRQLLVFLTIFLYVIYLRFFSVMTTIQAHRQFLVFNDERQVQCHFKDFSELIDFAKGYPHFSNS